MDLPAGSRGEVVLYAEAEEALADLGSGEQPGLSTGRDALKASNWYYVYRTPGAERGAAKLRANVAVSGAYHLWLRVRSTDETPAGWALSVDGRAIGEARATGPEWTWVSVASEGVRLAAGPHEVELSTTDGGAQFDLLCLATDPDFRPEGPRPEDRRPPEPPQNLAVRGVRDRTVQLTWDPPGDADFSHFNVYGSREALAGPAQEHLLASPTYPEFIDWGLRPGTLYHYAVTAVDRRGNESALSGQVQTQTPPAASPRHDIELLFEQAKLEGPFESGEGPGTHGKRYAILPETIPADEAARATATWTINVPDAGTHYLWLRYLPRGAASSREAAVVQDIRVLLDGRRIASVGGGETDLSTPDSNLRPEFWTWARPVRVDLVGVDLPAGEQELRLENLTASVRYDSLLLTNEPSFLPPDGRLRQR
jgi:hypothetical protein